MKVKNISRCLPEFHQIFLDRVNGEFRCSEETRVWDEPQLLVAESIQSETNVHLLCSRFRPRLRCNENMDELLFDDGWS